MYFVQRDEAYLYTPDSHTPLAIKDSNLGVLHIDTDHLGTPKAAYEHESGEQIWHTEQDVYGKTKHGHTEKNHPKTGIPAQVNLRFQGQYEDVETGLYYNLNRYYDPSTGRYINHDPIGMSGGLNLYQYCPNPVEWVDPLGLVAKEDCPKDIVPDPLRMPSYEELLAQAKNELDFSTTKDGAVFWSSNDNTSNMRTAQDWAAKRGKHTLEQTKGGQYLNELNLFGPDSGLTPQQASKIWDTASLRFANQASGDLNVFSTRAKKLSSYGHIRTWWRIEKDALINNDNVTSVTRLKLDGSESKVGHIRK